MPRFLVRRRPCRSAADGLCTHPGGLTVSVADLLNGLSFVEIDYSNQGIKAFDYTDDPVFFRDQVAFILLR